MCRVDPPFSPRLVSGQQYTKEQSYDAPMPGVGKKEKQDCPPQLYYRPVLFPLVCWCFLPGKRGRPLSDVVHHQRGCAILSVGT